MKDRIRLSGAARAESNLFELCRVVTERGDANRWILVLQTSPLNHLGTLTNLVTGGGFEPPTLSLWNSLATTAIPRDVELQVGFEPTACSLQVSCSTNWAIEAKKGVRRGSNPWPLDPQTSTLPTELPTPYSCWGDRTRTCEVEWRLIYSQLSLPLENTPIKVEPCGFEPHSQDFQSCAYTKSAKAPSKSGSRRIRTSGPDWINTLAVCRFQPLTHTSFLIDDAKVEGRSAAFLRS